MVFRWQISEPSSARSWASAPVLIACSRTASLRLGLSALALLFTSPSLNAETATTTIYINSYFEVRDHDQPTKYVFNGQSRVASVIGSLSASERVQRIRLVPGWNLCSLAINGIPTLSDGGPLPAVVSSAYRWDASSMGWVAEQFEREEAPGAVFWIKAATNATLVVTGKYREPGAYPLGPGGSYVPAAGLEAWAPAFPADLFAWTYDSLAGQWQESIAKGLAAASDWPGTVAPGQAFFAQTEQGATIETPPASLRIRYYHEDHLGSASVLTDARGLLLEETAFYPFGVTRSRHSLSPFRDPYDFTQKERDTETGLHYFEARYLAGPLGRFSTPDMKYENPEDLQPEESDGFLMDPQKMNLYSYVRNNPLRFVDPTGMDGKSPSPAAAKPQVLVIYGHDMFEDFHKRTGISRATYEKALKGAYEAERRKAGDNAVIVVKYVESKKQLNNTFRGSSYNTVIFDTHGYLNQKGLILKANADLSVEDVSPEDLQNAVAGAKTVPKSMYFYGCNTAKTGFAQDVSERLGSTEVTGAASEIAQDYTTTTQGGGTFSLQENRNYNVTYSGGKETHDARKIDINNATLPR